MKEIWNGECLVLGLLATDNWNWTFSEHGMLNGVFICIFHLYILTFQFVAFMSWIYSVW